MNLYWAVYENLEEEILSLADDIFFDDNQLGVYSLKIGNLIIRCSIEIESLSKELYSNLCEELEDVDKKVNEKQELFFDTDCLSLLVDKWKIDRKKIQISNHKMQFSLRNSLLSPLHKSHKRGTSGSKWKQAYQAFKHNRASNLTQATVGNLLNALGALYILNLYYSNDLFWYDVPIEGREEYRRNSKIFSPFIYEVPGNILASDEQIKTFGEIPFEDCIYLKRFTDNTVKEIKTLIFKYNLDIALQTITSERFIQYKQEHLDEKEKIDADFINKLGLGFRGMTTKVRVDKIPPEIYRSKEVVLNKNQEIYPRYEYKDFLKTSVAKQMINDRVTECNKKLNLVD